MCQGIRNNALMDSSKYQLMFREIIRRKHGVDIDFETIEKSLGHLRKGDPLNYNDLEIIAYEKYWPFKKYWMWPAKEQIEGQLAETKGIFIGPACEEKNDKKIIKKLSSIFRNIALVSIVLRFVWPEHYAIYSRPPLKILRVERGDNDLEEYMNYIREMRLLRKSFGVHRAADIDTIIWVISQRKRKEEYDEFL